MYSKKYPKSLIFIHWLTFILLLVIYYIGLTLEAYEFNEANMNRYRLHALLGVSVLILTLIRIFIRRKNFESLPPPINYYSNLHKLLVISVHYLLYIFLIFAPLIGFIMVYQTGALSYDLGGPFPTNAEFDHFLAEIHEFSVFTLLALIVIHITGVIIYKLKTDKSILDRMLP